MLLKLLRFISCDLYKLLSIFMMRPSIFSRVPKRGADDDDLNMSMAKRTKLMLLEIL